MSRCATMAAVPSRHAGGDAVMPADAAQIAIAAVERLADQWAADQLFGFLEPRVLRASHWSGELDRIRVTAVRPAYRSRDGVVVTWRWGVLWTTDDWYEVGWLPDDQIYALNAPWQARLQDALNAGKWRRHIRARVSSHSAGRR